MDVNSISFNNFGKICRLCLINGELKPFLELHVFKIFVNIVDIKISPEDELPKSICKNCIKQLEDIGFFVDRCKTSDSTLKCILSKENERLSQYYNSEDNSISNSPEQFSDDNESISKSETLDKTDVKDEKETSTGNRDKKINTSNKNNCKKCKKAFDNRPLLSKHYRESVKCRPKNYKLLKCELCGKEFTTAQRRKDHMNIHTGATPHSCTYCGESFKNYSAYFKHVYKHKLALGIVEKKDAYTEKRVRLKLMCQQCPDKIFASRSGYANHLLTKHGDGKDNKSGEGKDSAKRFLCNYCAKSFSTKIVLEGHLRVHTGEKPFECTECGKQFKQRGGLKMHQLNHLENRPRPFKCEICERTFTQKDHCEVHKRTHTGEKPYSCDFCGKKFNYRTYWRIHLRMHTGEMPFSCSVCRAKYHDKSSLRKHQKKKGHIAEKFDCF